MKIRTQLIAGIVVFAFLLVIISGFIISTNQQLDRLMAQEDIANSIALKTGELGYLSNDYILYREARQAERWNAKYDSIAEEISRLDTDQPEQRAIASSLASSLKNTKSVFNEIVSGTVQPGGAEAGFVQLSWSRMAVQNQGMVFDAGRLAHLIREEEDALRGTRLFFIFALMGTFVAFLLTSYLVFYRRTLRSIGNLQTGAKAVGSGNFGYTIDESADDEIGDLARSFNRMVSDLKTVTASKAELEKEVRNRVRAEEDLVYANDRLIRSEQDLIQRNTDLNAINEELTATQEELQQNVDELTRAERMIRESEERFRILLQHVPSIAVQGYAPDGTIQYWNKASERLYGYTAEEALGKNLVDLIIPHEMRDEVRMAIATMTGSGQPIPSKELRLMRKDGSRIPVFSSHGVVKKSSGETELFCIDIDLTERKKAEEALRKSEAEYRHVVEHAPASIYEISADGHRFNRVNDAMCRILGYTREELLGMSPFSILDDESRERFRERVQKRTGGQGIDESVGYRVLAKDGRVLWVTLNIRLDCTTGGSTLVVAHDITDRKRAEDALRESEEKFRIIFETANEGIWITDDERKTVLVNQRMADMLGYPVRDLIGTIPSVFLADGQEQLRHETWQDLNQGEATHREFRFRRRDETDLWVISSASPVFDSEGRLLRTVSLLTDITKRKAAEEELQRRLADLNAAYEEISATQEELHRNIEELSHREQELIRSEAELKDALAEKEILLSEIHHRVKNNLAAFISLLSLDGTYEETEAGLALRKDLQNRARSMALIHETLYRTGKFSSVDMEIYLTTLTGQIAGTWTESGRIQTAVDARGVVLDLARATTAGLIVNELVTNSFKYAFPSSFDCIAERGEPCTIRVTFSQEDSTYLLTVSDNGRGLPADFDPLAVKSLGLRLVTFLARHQLRAEITVVRDRGTKFIFRLKKPEEPA